jgi:hypothetical protein
MNYLREEPGGPSPHRGHDDGIYTKLSRGNLFLALLFCAQLPPERFSAEHPALSEAPLLGGRAATPKLSTS